MRQAIDIRAGQGMTVGKGMILLQTLPRATCVALLSFSLLSN